MEKLALTLWVMLYPLAISLELYLNSRNLNAKRSTDFQINAAHFARVAIYIIITYHLW